MAKARFRWSIAVHLAEQALALTQPRAHSGGGWELVGLGRSHEHGNQYRRVATPTDAYAHLGTQIRRVLDGYNEHPLKTIAGNYHAGDMDKHFGECTLSTEQDRATAVVAFALFHKSYVPTPAAARAS